MKEKALDLGHMGPRILVVGLGGAGNNAVNNMIRSNLTGVQFLVCNTDAQALSQSLCGPENRICLGLKITQGLGAGSSPDVGRAAAEESIGEVMEHLRGTHMVFIAAGMGGGTGTGAGAVIAKAAKDMGILTIGVVTKPFHFEGVHRMRVAEKGISEIRECVDTLLVIPNQNLFRLANQNTTFIEAFAMADEVLHSGVRTFTDLMIKPGLVNSDFADICAVMRDMKGKAMMGTGEARGEHRAIEAAEKAIGGLLLDDVSIRGAKAVLINITGGHDLPLYLVEEAANVIRDQVDAENTQIIFGATFDPDMVESIRVSVVATGIEEAKSAEASPLRSEELVAANVSAPSLVQSQTLGSRHEDYQFESAPSSMFLLQEEREAFGVEASEPPQEVRGGEEGGNVSWLDRWLRRRPSSAKEAMRGGAPRAGYSHAGLNGQNLFSEQQYHQSAQPTGAQNVPHNPYHSYNTGENSGSVGGGVGNFGQGYGPGFMGQDVGKNQGGVEDLPAFLRPRNKKP